MPTESAPPIHDLPDEIETAIQHLDKEAANAGSIGPASDFTAAATLARKTANWALRETIRAALDDQDAALRERAERLRQGVLHASTLFPPDLLFGTNIRESDVADNLRPRGGDER